MNSWIELGRLSILVALGVWILVEPISAMETFFDGLRVGALVTFVAFVIKHAYSDAVERSGEVKDAK